MSRADGRVLIIGGGLLGCALAWHLARGGARVVLAESAELNSGASGQNAGSLHFQLERRFLEHGAAATEHAAQIVALNAAAIEDWRGLERELDADLDVTMHGGLMVAETPAEVALLEDKCRRERAAGLPVRLIDASEARTLCPALAPDIVAAAFSPDEGHADPRWVTLAYARRAAASGASLRPGTRAAMLARSASGQFEATLVTATASTHEPFERVVITAGAWSAEVGALLNLHLPLYPVALQMNVTERTGPVLRHLLQHVGQRLSMKQTRSGNLLIGGGWAARLARQEGRFDLSSRPTLSRDALIGNLRVAARTVPAVGRLALLRSWTGVTAISADQLPLVGEIPRMRGCYVAAGGSAFTLGPTFARLLSSTLLGRHEELLGPVSPARFDHLNSFMGS
jgi:sarcosine oxidase, subunit beta